MTQKNFSFWLCTLLSGVIIGIASQRIPEAYANRDISCIHSHSLYANDSNQAILPSKYFAYEDYCTTSWEYEHVKKNFSSK